MQNLFSSDNSSLTMIQKRFQEIIEVYMEVLHIRYQEIVEFYKDDKLDLPLSEKIYSRDLLMDF